MDRESIRGNGHGPLPALSRPIHHGAKVAISNVHAVGFSALGGAEVMKTEGAPDPDPGTVMQMVHVRREQLLRELTLLNLWLAQVQADSGGGVVRAVTL